MGLLKKNYNAAIAITEGKIPRVFSLATSAALTAVEKIKDLMLVI